MKAFALNVSRRTIFTTTRSLDALRSSPTELKALYSGPYTESEVFDLEDFAAELYHMHKERKLVNPWLRAKLGPYYKAGWMERVHQRRMIVEREKRWASRPADSTHFSVLHGSEDTSNNNIMNADQLFAIIGLSGTQFKVTKGDVLICDRLRHAEVGTTIDLTDILLIGSKGKTLVGRPNVPNWIVKADIEQQTKEKKILAFYKRPKTHSQKLIGSRRDITVLRIADILQIEQEENKQEIKKE